MRWVDYHYGRRVHRKTVPTGRQVSKVIKGGSVVIPGLMFDVIPSDPTNSFVALNVWETITIDATFDEAYIRRLVDKYHLHVPDGSDVVEMAKSGKPFTAKVQNIINFNQGIAGKVYVF
jgi:hypothetical protein